MCKTFYSVESHEFLNDIWGQHFSNFCMAEYKAAFISVLSWRIPTYCALRSYLLKFSFLSSVGLVLSSAWEREKHSGDSDLLHHSSFLPPSRQLLDEQQLLLTSFLADEELVPVQPANWPAKLPVLFMDTGDCQESKSTEHLSCQHLIEVLCLCLHV